MSRARFAANFKTIVGTTPLDYLTDWRLSIAQTLIRQGKPLKSIAAQVGYQSTAAFSRVFTKRVGATPAEWA
jgi:AraC-like DNA-binding protein